MTQTIQWQPAQAAPRAFAERQALMPIWGGVPVPHTEWQTLWQQSLPLALESDGLAYIHIPFCANHCVFCGFYRNAWRESQGGAYVDKVIEELAQEAPLRQGPGRVQAVYFGGGTPTALATPDLVRLIEACRRYLPLSDDCEFTLEGRISHFGLDKARAAMAAGVNRISIGIQTFNTPIRQRLGRKHSGDDAWRYLAELCELDAVVVADLIFGLPGQSDEIWTHDIERASALPLAGLDVYAFNCYPHLPINRLVEKGALPPPEGFDRQALQYAQAVHTLTARGWRQVSNSHFAWPGRGERNRYNTLVKSNMPCLAFGSGAGGNLGGFSFQVQGDLQSYLATPRGVKNIAHLSRHGAHKRLLAQVQHDMELGHINTAAFADNAEAQTLLRQWEAQSLLHTDAQGLAHLNTSGRYWSPTLTRKLMLTLKDEKEPAMLPLSAEQQTTLRNTLAEKPGQVLEMLAAQHQCSLEEVIHCLPADMVRKTGSERFVEIMHAVADWGTPVTFIAHTPDVIAEVTGKLPKGSIGRGFYNFAHAEEGGIHGHIYYENCAAIYFVERPFMGKATASLNFINRKGGAMFKIFVGRDAQGELLAPQLEAMRALFADAPGG